MLYQGVRTKVLYLIQFLVSFLLRIQLKGYFSLYVYADMLLIFENQFFTYMGPIKKERKLIIKFALLNDDYAPTKDCLKNNLQKANLKFLPNLKDFITIRKYNE